MPSSEFIHAVVMDARRTGGRRWLRSGRQAHRIGHFAGRRRKRYCDLRSWPDRDSKPFLAAAPMRRRRDRRSGIPQAIGSRAPFCSANCPALRWPAC